MATRMASSLSAFCIAMAFLVLAFSTCAPFVNMGVMTMKMISSTSMTSTIGVTLISLTTGGAFCFFIRFLIYRRTLNIRRSFKSRQPTAPFSGPHATRPRSTYVVQPNVQLANATAPNFDRTSWSYFVVLFRGRALGALEEVIDQFRTRVPHLDVESFHAIGEVVEHHHRGDGDEQTHGGGHQGFRNTARDRAQSSRLFSRNALERVNDAQHRSQQSDERSRRSHRGQRRNAALQLG